MAIRSGIEIKGLVDFRKALRDLNRELPKELGNINKAVADFVVQRAKGRASTDLEHRAADTLKAARTQRVALVRLGGPKYPEALGAEFGAIQGIPRNTHRGTMQGWNQFRPWRGNSTEAGYFLYPTIREDTPEIIEMYGNLLEQLARKAFPA